MNIATSTSPSDDASNDLQSQLTKLPQANDLAKSKDLLDSLYKVLRTCVKYNEKFCQHRGWSKAIEKLFDGVWKDKFRKPFSPKVTLRNRLESLYFLSAEGYLNHSELCIWLKEWKEQSTNDESRNRGEYTPSTEQIVKDKGLLKTYISVLVKCVKRDEKNGRYKGWKSALDELFSHELWNKFKKPVNNIVFFSTRSKSIYRTLRKNKNSIPKEFERWLKDWNDWNEQKDGINEDKSESSSEDEFLPDRLSKKHTSKTSVRQNARRTPRVTQKKKRSVTTAEQENSTQAFTSDLDSDSESDPETYKSPFNRKKKRNSSELNNERKCKTYKSPFNRKKTRNSSELNNERKCKTYKSPFNRKKTRNSSELNNERKCKTSNVIDLIDSDSEQEDLQQPEEQTAKRQRTKGSSTEKQERKVKQEEDEMEVHKLRQLEEQALFNQRLIGTKEKDKEQQQRMVELSESEMKNHWKMIESLNIERESHLEKIKSLQDKIKSYMDKIASHQTKKENAQSKIEEIDSDINGLKQSVESVET